MKSEPIGELLYSHARCTDNTVDADGKPVFVECRDEQGNFKPKYSWTEVTSVLSARGMVIHEGAVRIRLPDGVSRRADKQDLLRHTLLMKYIREWPNVEPCTVVFPTHAFGQAFDRYVDIYPRGDTPSPAQVGERIVSRWKFDRKPFRPPFFLRPDLPANVTVVEVHGLYPFALDKFAREAQATFNALVDPASKTRSVVCDVWAVKSESVKGKFAFTGRVCLVVEVFDLDGNKIEAVRAAHRWPGSLPGCSLSTEYTLGFINRFPYCHRCSSTIYNIDKRHTTDKCPKIKCTDCGAQGHFRSACPRNIRPPQIGTPAITSTQLAFYALTPAGRSSVRPGWVRNGGYALGPWSQGTDWHRQG